VERIARHRDQGTLPPVDRRITLALLGALVALSGCGADTEDGGGTPDATTEVRATVARFGVATRQHDWQTICDDLLSATLVTKIEDVGLPCETAIEKGLGDVRNPTLEITDVSLAGVRALVSIHTTAAGQEASDDALQLVKEGGAWRIASLAAPKGAQASSTAPPATTTATTTTTTATTATTTTSTAKTRTATTRSTPTTTSKRR
jgi:hypothetical protein